MRRAVDVSSAQVAREAGIGGLAASPWGRPLISELLESIPDPVIGCDVDGRVVYWSRAAREAYGYSSDEAIGEPVIRLLKTRFPAPLTEIMEEVTDLGRWQGRLTHRTRDGRDVVVESRWVARYDDAGQLVGGVAHDFNNALAIVVNYTAFVGEQLRGLRSAPTDAQRDSLQRDLEEIAAAADRAVELNHRLLAFARQEPGPQSR